MTAFAALRAARLTTGLVLATFVATHLANLSLGLVSVAAMDAARAYHSAVWASGLGSTLLIVSAIVHLLAGLASIAARRTLAVPLTDRVQMVLGLAILPVLLSHVIVARISAQLAAGIDISYATLLAVFWQVAPTAAIQQLTVVIVVWVHAGIGLVTVMQLRPWWQARGWMVLAVIFGLPIVALLGFVEGGKDVIARLAAEPALAERLASHMQALGRAGPAIEEIKRTVLLGYAGALAVVAVILAIRLLGRPNGRVKVHYDGDWKARGCAGQSILDISRASHIPHASICSGRGRCGTCRVKILAGAQNLTPLEDLERKVLKGAEADGVRLACRARISAGSISVVRLIAPEADSSAAHTPQAWLASQAPGGAA